MFAHLLVKIDAVLRNVCHLDSRRMRQHPQVLQQSKGGRVKKVPQISRTREKCIKTYQQLLLANVGEIKAPRYRSRRLRFG